MNDVIDLADFLLIFGAASQVLEVLEVQHRSSKIKRVRSSSISTSRSTCKMALATSCGGDASDKFKIVKIS